MVIVKNGRLSFFYKMASGSNFKHASDSVFSEILKVSKLKPADIVSISATGCGSERVSFANHQVSDLTSSAVGTHTFFPEVRTVIEVGGQSSKVLRVNDMGKIINFIVSEKCASGSGRFLQVMARVLQ